MMRKHSPKRELTPMALQRLRARIWEMPWIDRINILSLSIIDREKESLASALGLAAMIATLTKGCGAETRIRVAESLRNSADVLDHALERDEIHG